MLKELRPQDSRPLIDLFESLRFTIAVDAIITGNKQGKIFADNIKSPCLGVLWDYADGIYIAGKTTEESYERDIQVLRSLFCQIILPEALKNSNEPVFVIYCFPERLNLGIPTLFNVEWIISQASAVFFEFPSSIPSWSDNETLSGNLILQPITPALQTYLMLEDAQFLTEEIKTNWGTLDNFFRSGLGYLILDIESKALISWCLVDTIGNQCAELGVETISSYRKKGLATIVAKETIKACLQSRLTPHWYCFSDNLGSMALAEKLGFSLIKEFEVTICHGSKNILKGGN
ncbi:MAG: GNAT family N-acetyltransferase [Candidatus Hodarchaeota archaeon]